MSELNTYQHVAGLWCTLLNVPDVDASDNFFAIGGDSILAVEFIFAIESDLGIEVPLGAFFVCDTYEDVVRLVVKTASLGSSS